MEEVAEALVRELPAALTCPPPSCEITLTPFYRCYHLVWWPGFLRAHVFSITRLTLIPTFLSRAYVFLWNSRFPSPVPLSLFLLIPVPSMRIALSLQYRACFRLSHSLSSIPPSSRDGTTSKRIFGLFKGIFRKLLFTLDSRLVREDTKSLYWFLQLNWWRKEERGGIFRANPIGIHTIRIFEILRIFRVAADRDYPEWRKRKGMDNRWSGEGAFVRCACQRTRGGARWGRVRDSENRAVCCLKLITMPGSASEVVRLIRQPAVP